MLIKNTEHSVNIEDMNHFGYGVARIDGIAVFVPGAMLSESCLPLKFPRKNEAPKINAARLQTDAADAIISIFFMKPSSRKSKKRFYLH